MPIYLDHAATSPMPAEVLDVYTAELARRANPSALHAVGQAARMRIEQAREDIADAVGAATSSEVIFTSGGTEADNFALKGLYLARNGGSFDAPARPRVLTSTIEHHAILDSVEWLETQGAEVVSLDVDAEGRLDLDAALAELRREPERTAVISIMAANNEIGTIQPIAEIGAAAKELGVPFHIDAVQALGQIPLDFAALGATAMTITAHKIGGPVGIGALLLDRAAAPAPILHGGGQERGVRSGTLDVAGAVAFAKAVELSTGDLEHRAAGFTALRDRLIDGIESTIDGARLSGRRGRGRLPANAHFTFTGCEGDSLLFGLDARGLATSTGSACSAGVSRPSHVLLACGMDEDTARSAQRFSLGHDTIEAEVDALLEVLPAVVDQARRAGMVSATPRWMQGAS
ncbi:cysteine desulfurase family protein [Brevibacterium sp. GP-SGM9]|uniref:cysteine desulfurase family protein n=1 Tax=unclassified Brevibacterium TaxID=2614124 RepID=UPI001E657BD5|nr:MULTISPECIES: cysteine desulfurase family protein [unclassified Brevibacterium]MCD1285809.1 cysteine desulfurase NifS [Brevibacterium sp. CCUG 69071]MDK8434870.1 cysteine desulfurase family protein [Brevibacterium sp. H-BE7]